MPPTRRTLVDRLILNRRIRGLDWDGGRRLHRKGRGLLQLAWDLLLRCLLNGPPGNLLVAVPSRIGVWHSKLCKCRIRHGPSPPILKILGLATVYHSRIHHCLLWHTLLKVCHVRGPAHGLLLTRRAGLPISAPIWVVLLRPLLTVLLTVLLVGTLLIASTTRVVAAHILGTALTVGAVV